MDAGRSFDESARGAELRLAELRRLLSGSVELTPEQESALATLTETLAGVEQGALALRNSVLNAPEAPAGFVEKAPQGVGVVRDAIADGATLLFHVEHGLRIIGEDNLGGLRPEQREAGE